jgi:hypothetical protein
LVFAVQLVDFIASRLGHARAARPTFNNELSRGKRKKGAAGLQAAADEPAELSPAQRERRRSWAEMIRRVYEVDPLVCPSCGG